MTKFIVDEMHGHLVRWLRILGFDTLAASDLRGEYSDVDKAILVVAMRENRIVVTSDRQLAYRANRLGIRVVQIETSLSHTEALRKILSDLNISEEARQNLFTRCPLCNGILVRVGREQVANKVPPAVFRSHNEFWLCDKCGKVYWVGSHFRNIRRVLSEVL